MLPDTKIFKRGLVVGKFSPLHLGHEYLISQAEAECDELVLLSWSKPELPGCESNRRRNWLQKRFAHLPALVLDDHALQQLAQDHSINEPRLPDNDAPDTESRHFVGWVCEKLLHYRPDVIFTSEDYGDGFAEELTRYFLERENDTPKIVHRCVDKARQIVPISGTALRQDPHTLSAFLAPEVYADFVERIVLLGGESTGKTTLAAALAKVLNTHWAAEYGRELWEAQNGHLQYSDMLHIAQKQIAREETLAASARRFLVCDSSPLTTYFYSLVMFERAEPELVQLAERPYAQVFLCAADFEFVQDGTRRNNEFRLTQQRWYQQQLAARGTPYTLLQGNVEQRVQHVLMVLDAPRSPNLA